MGLGPNLAGDVFSETGERGNLIPTPQFTLRNGRIFIVDKSSPGRYVERLYLNNGVLICSVSSTSGFC